MGETMLPTCPNLIFSLSACLGASACHVYVHSYGHSGSGVVFTMNILCLKKALFKYMLTKYKNLLFEPMLRTLKKINKIQNLKLLLKSSCFNNQ